MNAVMSLEGVSCTFTSGWGSSRRRVEAMREVSFDIHRGETLGLVGESGSGKSTTGRVALGLQKPTSGRVLFEGEPLGSPKSARGRRQLVPQNPLWSLDPRLPVAASIAEPLAALRGGSLRSHRAAVESMLRDVRLDVSLADRYPHELSGGQRQRVAIARALITHPPFIVFDEAVSALDVSVQTQILNLLRDLQEEHGFAALFISHDLAAVRYLAHRIAVMRLGEIVELADTERFSSAPAHEYSRQLLEAL